MSVTYLQYPVEYTYITNLYTMSHPQLFQDSTIFLPSHQQFLIGKLQLQPFNINFSGVITLNYNL